MNYSGFCECLYLHLNTTTSQTTPLPIYTSHSTVNMKHTPPWLAIEEKNMHMLAPLALSFSIHLWMTFDYIKIPDSLKNFLYFYFSFSCFSFMQFWIWLRTCTLVPSRFSSRLKSTPWQVVSALQRLTLEIQYSLPTYPHVEQGWDFPEIVLWHVNLQIRW